MMAARSVFCLYLLARSVAASPSCTGAACQAAALEGAADPSVSLLQRRGAGAGASPRERRQRQPALAAMDPESQAQRLQAALPVAWLHVPKCGSSLNNFMIHLPGVCPGVADDVVISVETMGPNHNSVFKHDYDPLSEDGACPGGFSTWGNHQGAGPNWDSTYSSHTFVMLRQPEQRILSGYNFGHHSWPYSDRQPADELEYAQVIQGCAVRMITRGGQKPGETCGGGRDPTPLTDAEVQLAIERIRHDTAFVGITDQWALSMCLGHRMFGGKCRTSDFLDGRTTDPNGSTAKALDNAFVSFSLKPHLYDLSPLKGFHDPYDGALYQAALEVFQDELLRYNVTQESCQPCWDEAGLNITA